VELHNFNVGLIASINAVKEPMKEEILQKIKEKERDKVQRTTPFCYEFFLGQTSQTCTQKRGNWGFWGSIDTYSMVRSGYSQLEKDFKTKMLLDDFIKDFASKIMPNLKFPFKYYKLMVILALHMHRMCNNCGK